MNKQNTIQNIKLLQHVTLVTVHMTQYDTHKYEELITVKQNSSSSSCLFLISTTPSVVITVACK